MPPVVVITGAAGFIGFHVARRLLAGGFRVVGFDNLNAYYAPRLKWDRLAVLEGHPGWRFIEGDLCDAPLVADVIQGDGQECVIHLAAQAGVRWSLENPAAYVQSNLVGFANILEACRQVGTGNLIYASSSSVYGANTKTPFDVQDGVNHPVSLYAATKKANEAMAHSYAHLFGVPCTGLRFFTVYGPWGRPDMAYWKFTEAILEGKPIDVFGGGELRRDFTFVDDVVEAIARMVASPARPNALWSGDRPDPATSAAPWRIYNVGNHTPVTVNEMLEIIEAVCGKKALRNDRPKPPGDVEATFAGVESLSHDFGFQPQTSLREGLSRFVDWYRSWRDGSG